MNYVEALNIEKTFRGTVALNNVSIHIPKGEIYGLLGPNGAGKTTLIRILNRISSPDKGNLLYQGNSYSTLNTANIGYLPEERGLYKKMKVGEQAVYLGVLKGLSKKEATQKLQEWFEKLEITDWWFKKVETLSKGMAQKIQFITTILHNPEFIILDEPFSGFDPINSKTLKEEVLRLKKEGKTIILSTHDMASVEELCDSITLINKAETILEGKVCEVQQSFKKNIFELTYQGTHDLSSISDSGFSVESFEPISNTESRVVIRSSEPNNSNAILSKIIPHVQVISYREILPSMNEVFIEAVKNHRRKA